MKDDPGKRVTRGEAIAKLLEHHEYELEKMHPGEILGMYARLIDHKVSSLIDEDEAESYTLVSSHLPEDILEEWENLANLEHQDRDGVEGNPF